MQNHRVLAGAILLSILAGCEAPVVSVRHPLPPDVPIHERPIAVAEFRGPDGGSRQYGRLYAAQLSDRLRATGSREVHLATGAEGNLHGLIECKVTEHAGVRELRYWDASSRTLKTEVVPTLRRDVDVRVVHIFPPEPGAPEARVETRASYSSAGDPRTRGKSGLLRGDRPEAIPPEEDIIKELLATCSDEFAMMVRPKGISADVALRPGGGAEGAAGIAAMESQEFEAAVRHFGDGVARSPRNVNLLFNLAVAEEAAGHATESLKHYEAVLLMLPKDAAVQQAIDRVRHLLACRQHEQALQGMLRKAATGE